MALAAVLVAVLLPRAALADRATLVVLVSSAGGDRLPPTTLAVAGTRSTVSGAVPAAPQVRRVAAVPVPPGTLTSFQFGGQLYPVSVTLAAGQTAPILIAVAAGQVAPAGVYAGSGDTNLGLGELAGSLTPMPEVNLVDQDGSAFNRSSLAGQDTVIAAFHTTCHESCPLYTGLFSQLRRSSPGTRLVEVTTDPATDLPATLRDYRRQVGADWTLVTGSADELARFWGYFKVSLASGDTHQSVLVIVDAHGFLRGSFTGTPDLGGSLPGPIASQLDDAGRRLLATHGDGWGSPQVLDALRTVAGIGAPPSASGDTAPAFTLTALDGRRVSLADSAGRPVVLNFWQSACVPCRTEMPLLERTAAQHPGLVMLLVDVRDDGPTARRLLASLRVTSPALADADGAVAGRYQVAGLPTTIFIRPDGTVAERHPGALSPAVLEASVGLLGPGA